MTTENKKPQTTDLSTKKPLFIDGVRTRYLCECGWKGNHEEMKREYDFGYDQSCCPECNNVLTNNLNWEVHCNVC